MIQTSQRMYRVLNLSRVLMLCLLMPTLGCGPEQTAIEEQQMSTRERVVYGPSGYLTIFVSDNRTLSNVVVTFDGYNSGTHVSDWEAVSGDLTGTDKNAKYRSDMSILNRTSDQLDEWSYGANNDPDNPNRSKIQISGFNATWTVRPEFSNVRVTVNASIAGACHEDYEDIPQWSGDVALYFNGNGASWDGSCYRGDLLRSTP